MKSDATVGRAAGILGALAIAVLAPATAYAQAVCVDGRVEVFGGYCCWPGQSATAEGRCTGPPRCPGGLAAAGADCVAPAVSAGRAVPGYGVPAYGGSSDGSFRTTEPARGGGNEVRGGLLGGGIALILVGWLGSGITFSLGGGVTTSVYTGFGYVAYPALPSWPFGWVPILHPFGALNATGTWAPVAGVIGGISAAMEIAGLVMAIVGQIGAPRAAPPTPGWSVRLGAPSADGGLSLALAF